MPYKSKAQIRYIQGIAHGMKPRGGKGMSQEAAQKFVADSKGQDTSKLPARIAGAIVSGKGKGQV